MSRLTDLLAQVKKKDSALGTELEREFNVLSGRRAFGLNFERHRPESVELPGRPVNSRKSYPEAQPRNGDEGQDLAKVQHRAWFGGS